MKHPHHLPVLDGARGMAALVVLLAHSGQTLFGAHFLQGFGQMGVTFFFMLSGFLMTWLYAGRPFTRAELVRYAAHRAGRVLPLYYAVVLLSALIGSGAVWFFPFEGRFDLPLHLLLLAGQQTLWTIPVEVQFYALFPILWHDGKRGHPWRAILIIGGAIALAGLVISQLAYHGRILPLWCHFFLIGAATALLIQRTPDLLARYRTRRAGWLLLTLFLAAIPGVRLAAGVPVLQNYIDPLTGGATALLFLGCVFGVRPLHLLATPVPRWLGKVSYGLYLLHLPVMMTVRSLELPPPAAFFLFLAITAALAALSHHLFEAPLRRRISRLGDKASGAQHQLH